MAGGRRRTLVGLFALAGLAALFALLLVPSASATTVVVDGSLSANDPANHTWKTVQSGIYDAAPGDTVYIHNGTYNENVTVWNNTVTLQGESQDGVIIDRASSPSVPVLTISAHHVLVQNLTLTRGNYGVYSYGSGNHNATLENVTIQQISGSCLYEYQARDWTLHELTVSACTSVGIYMQGDTPAVNYHHRLWNIAVDTASSGYGIEFYNMAGVQLTDFTIQDPGSYGLYLSSANNLQFSRFLVNSSTSTGVYLTSSHGIQFDNGSVWNNSGDAFYIYSSDYGRLDNITIENNSAWGQEIYYSSFWTWRNVRNTNAPRPVYVYYPAPMPVSYLQYDVDQSNTIYGIPVVWFTNATGGSFTGVTSWFLAVNSTGLNVTLTAPITNVQYGAIILNTQASTFANFNLTNNDWNLLLDASGNNTLRNTTQMGIRPGGGGGFYLYNAHFNTFDGGTWTNTSQNYNALDMRAPSSNNTFHAIAVRGWSYAFYFKQDTADNRIDNSTFEACYGAIRLEYVTSVTIEWSLFNNSLYEPIYVYGSSGIYSIERFNFNNNTLNHTQYYYSQAVDINYVTSGVFENNTIVDFYRALYVSQSSGLVFRNNVFGQSREYTFYATSSSYLEFYANTFTQGASGGIYLEYSSYFRFRSNTWLNQSNPVYFSFPASFVEPWANHDADTSNIANGLPILWVNNATTGSFSGAYSIILVTNSSNVTVTSTANLTRAACALIMIFANDSTARYLNTSGNGWSACIFASRGSSVTDSNLDQSAGGGVYLWYSSYITVARTRLRPQTPRTGYGVQVDTTSNNNTIESVDCDNFVQCFRTEYYSNTLSVLNSTANNTQSGVYSQSEWGPRVENSRFTNNTYENIVIYGGGGGRPARGAYIANNTLENNSYYYSYGFSGNYMNGGIIENNTINGTYDALYLYFTDGTLVQDNHFNGSRNIGAYLQYSNYIRLDNNNFTLNAAGGIYFQFSTYSRLRGNLITNQSYAVNLYISPGMAVAESIHDADSSNLVGGLPMLWVVNATSGSWNGSYGWLAASNTSNISLTSTTPLSRNSCGVMLMFTTDTQVHDVNATANGWGACVYFGTRALMVDSQVNNNTGGGVYAWRTTFFTLLRAVLRPNTGGAGNGVQFDDIAANGLVESIDCAQFYTCIRSEYYTADIQVRNSTISNVTYAVYSNSASGPWVEGNNISLTTYDSITVYGHGTAGVRIANNSINHVTYYYSNSLYLNSVAGAVIENNTFNDTYNGIYTYYQTSGLFQDNQFLYARYDAFYSQYSSGLTLINNHFETPVLGYGLELYESRYFFLSGNVFANNSRPVVFDYSDPVTDETLFMHTWTTSNLINGQPVRYYVNATGVVFTGPAGWIVAVNSTNMNLTATTTMGPTHSGVLLVKVFNSTVRGVATNGALNGALLYWGADNQILNLTANGSVCGVYLSNNTRATIDGARVTNYTGSCAGVEAAYGSTRVTVTRSSFTNVYQAVYALYGADYLNFTDNIVNNTYYGVHVDQLKYVQIRNNTINGSQYATFYLYGSASITLDSFVISGNRVNGTVYYYSYVIEAYYLYNALIDSNLFTNTSYGALYLYYSNANLFRNNTNRIGAYGYYLYQSDSNNIVDTTFMNQSSYAVYLDSGSDFNTLYHNNFYVTAGMTRDLGTSNLWSNTYPGGGNYWSNMTSRTDVNRGPTQAVAGADGINDTALFLSDGKRDSFPLMEPWPPYVTLVGPANLSVIRPGITLDWNISTYFDSAQYMVNNGTTVNMSSPWDINTSAMGDGDITVQIWANDTWYNISSWFQFAIDNTAPSISADSPPVGGTYPVGTQLNFTVSDAHLVANVTWNNGSGNNSFVAPWQISTTGWAEGDYNITVRAWDAAGNNRTSTFLFKLDSTAPTITLLTPSNNSFIAVGTTIDLSVFDVHLNVVTWNNGSGPNALAAPFDISTAGWSSATWNITVIANDTAGFTTTRVFTFTIDAVPPTITLNSPANNSVFDVGATLDFNVSDSNLASVTYNIGSGPVALTAPFDISTTGWADGAYNVTIVANDTSGNSASRTFHFEVDSAAPAISTVFPAAGAFIRGGQTADFAIVDAHFASATWSNGSGNNPLSSPFDVSLVGWSDGSYTIVVNASDTVGHTSSRSVSFTIDSVAPTVTLNSPANNSYFAVGRLLDFSAADTNLATVVASTGGAFGSLGSPYDIATTGFFDGPLTVRINATDLAGNFLNISFSFTIDSAAPLVTLNAPANNSYIAAGRLLDFAVSDANLATVVQSMGGAYTSLASPYDLSTAGFSDGPLTVRINATDLAGNFLNISFTFTIDSTPPVVTLNSPANNSYFAVGRLLDFAAADTNLATVVASTGGAFSSLASPYDISTTGFADGALTVRINATDLAGNFLNISFSFTVDSAAPTVTLNSPSNNSYFAAGRLLDFAVVDANIATVVSSTGGAFGSLASPYDISTAGFSEGALTVRINATDLAGNFLNISFSFTIDSTAPTVVLNSPSNNSYFAAGRTLDFAVADTNLQTVVSSTGGAYSSLASPYDISTTGFADAAITVRINATDLAGNFLNISFSFTVDSTAPTVSLVSPTAGSYFAAGRTLDFAVSDTNLGSVLSSTGGAYSALASPYDISTTGLPDGALTVRVNATDQAGNFANVSFTFTVDSTLPTLTLNGPSSGAVIKAGVVLDFTVADTNLLTAVWSTGGAPSNLSASFDIDTTGWADGSYSVSVNATDRAGNFRNNSYTYVIDSTPPSIVQTGPALGAFVPVGTKINLTISDLHLVNTTYERFHNSASMGNTSLGAPYQIDTAGWSDGDSVIVHADDSAWNVRNLTVLITFDSVGPLVVLISPLNGSVIRAGTLLIWNISDPSLQNASINNGTADIAFFAPWTVSTAGYFERNYNFTIFARDAANNTTVARFNFTVDTTPPQVQLLSPANNSWLRANAAIDFGVTDLHLTAVNMTIDGALTPVEAGYDYNSDNLTDGTHTFVLQAQDAAGNTRNLTAVFRVDKTPPVIGSQFADNAYVDGATPWTFVITEVNLQSATWANVSDQVFAPLPAPPTIDISSWPEGRSDVTVIALDQAGNSAQFTMGLTIDRTAPGVALSLAPNQKYIRSGVPIVFHIAGETSPYTYTFFLAGNPVALTDDGTGDLSFTFTNEPEDGFDWDFDFSVTDAAGNKVAVPVFSLKLDNTAPAFPSKFPMAYAANEDAPFELHGAATDALATSDELTWDWRFDPASPISSKALSNVSGQDANWTFDTPGQYDVEVWVWDPAGNANNTTFVITVFDITPPTVFVNTTFLSVPEDTPFQISQTSIDNGNGTLNWTWREPTANITSNGPNITWIFSTPGVYNITLTVRDPSNNTGQGYVIVDVQDITPPNATIIGPSVSDVLVAVNFRANATDNDPRYNSSLWTFGWTFVSASGTSTAAGPTATYVGLESGPVNVTLTVTDASDNPFSVSTTLTINRPPVVGANPPASANATEPWVWLPDITDPENDSTTISIVQAPPGMTVTSDGHLVWTPSASDIGTNVSVTVAVSDGVTTVLRTFSVFVVDPTNIAGNHKPVFNSDPVTDASVSKTYLYAINVTDEDHDPISFVITGLDGASFDNSTRTLSWVPPWHPVGDQPFEQLVSVTITAFDGKQSTSQDFVIRFRNPPNRFPLYIPSFGVGTHINGTTLHVPLEPYFQDPDDVITNLTFFVNSTDFDFRARVSGIVTWTVEPNATNPGHYDIVFRFVGTGQVNIPFAARDPSGARTESVPVSVTVVDPQIQANSGFPPWLIWVILAAIGAGGVGMAVALRRSRSAARVAQSALEAAAKAPTERVIIQQAPAVAGAGEKRKDTYVIEGVFVIYQDGRMIFSKTDASDVKLEDPELVASMFSAVQSFIKDSFQATGELNRLGFGENTILIERGTSIFMAAIIFGEPQDDLFLAMKETVSTIENAYAGIIEDWDGSTTSLEAIDQYVLPFLALTAARSRADVKAAMTEKIVKMLSELEFFQGFVRLKCGVKNDTESVITKVTVSIDFNEDVLRLHHIEPDTYKVQGSETQLGVLNPGEKVSVAYYFDPQICTESQIDGVARYRDAKGAVHSLSMKTRKAEVVCPIFFTKEHANTAMLKRLVEGELEQRDSKVFNVTAMPEKMTYEELFSLVKEVVLAHDVHLVRDFVKDAPYHGEAWFYGETKVKGYKIVIRASVMEDGKRIEFFAASTVMAAITGLLAEFNHTFKSLIGRKYATLKVESEFDQAVKEDIQKKSLMAKMSAGELEGAETDQDP